MKATAIHALVFFLIASMQAPLVHAHSGSTAYLELTLDNNQASGAYWVALKDMHAVVDLDLDNDSNIRYTEVKQQADAITLFVQNNWRAYAGGGQCAMDWQSFALSRLDDGVYLRLPVRLLCEQGANLSSLRYSGLFDVDTSHRLIGSIRENGVNRTIIFSPGNQTASWQTESSVWWQTLVTYLEQGVIHILEGYDHLLFLLALLVPIIFAPRKYDQSPSRMLHYRQLSISLLKVISAFTAGHSVTLILASVFAISPPIAWVETIIAISVVVAGINIVVPVFRESSWRVAALFGLVHGFGFASVLSELSLDKSALALSLLSFNLGVEVGQLFVVLIAAPFLILLAQGPYLPSLARYGAAGTAVSIGAIWAFERIPL
jgi:hydrogenase/urease accessory protein HupE